MIKKIIQDTIQLIIELEDLKDFNKIDFSLNMMLANDLNNESVKLAIQYFNCIVFFKPFPIELIPIKKELSKYL